MDAAATEKFISYMPEDGQTFASAQALRGKKLFGTSYNYKSYSVFWRKEDDVEARKVLKALRIRPMARFDGADPIAPARAPDSGSAGSWMMVLAA